MIAKGTLIAVIATAVLAAPALADDQSVYNAWISHDAGFSKAGRSFARAMSHRPPRTTVALRALRKGLQLIAVVDDAINAQQPRSDPGARGKTAALDSMNLFRLSLVHKKRGVRDLVHHRRRAAEREFTRATRLTKRSLQAENAARSAFSEAGVQIKH